MKEEDLNQEDIHVHDGGQDVEYKALETIYIKQEGQYEDEALETKGKSSCPHCGKYYKTSQLNLHIRVHTGERPFKCDVCSKAFKQLSQFETHKLTHTTQQYQCEKCDRKFKFPQTYKRHLKSHSEIKKFECDQCEYKCCLLDELNKHKFRHTDLRTVKCKLCNLMYKSKYSLRAHMRVHRKASYKCEICAKEFGLPSYLKLHMNKTHSSRRMECDKCGYRTGSASRFEKHVRRHQDGEKVEMLKCERCDYVTFGRRLMADHIRRHDSKLSLKCELCEYTARHVSYMRKHIIKFHAGIKNVKCSDCDKMFFTPIQMELHRQKTHVKEFQCERCFKLFLTRPKFMRHKRECKTLNVVSERNPLLVSNVAVKEEVVEEEIKIEFGDCGNIKQEDIH